MNKIPNEVSSYVSSIQEVHFFLKGAYLITDSGTYLYLEQAPDEENYSYLSNLSYTDYYPLVNSVTDSFQLFYLRRDVKKKEMLPFLLSLYFKSEQDVLWDLNQVQIIFQKIQKQYNDLLKYYYSLQDFIEEMYYPRNSFYKLLLSISSVYHLTYLGGYFLDKWNTYSRVSYREVLTVHNLEDWNCYEKGIVDFSSARKDNYLFEIANYYRKYYREEEVLLRIESFLRDFSATEEEMLLFYSLIAISWKVDGEDFEDVEDFLFYVKKTHSYLLEKYKEYEKTE